MTKRRWIAVLALLVAAGIGGSAASWLWPESGSATRGRSDLEEALDLSTQPADMVAMYHYAESHESLLRKVPCYCGCGRSIGHQDLFDCFVIKPGVYSDHASGCMVCGNEARDVERLSNEGQTPQAIRAWIDGEYSRYGAPTNTPQ
jgi:hypothetical protein